MFIIQYNNSIGNNNNKVNELYSLFLKFSALGLLQDIRNKLSNVSGDVASLPAKWHWSATWQEVIQRHHWHWTVNIYHNDRAA